MVPCDMFPILRRSDHVHHLGLSLLAGLLLFSPLLDGGTTHLAAMIMRLLILSALGLYLLKVINSKTLLFPRMAVGMPVLLFLVWAGVSATYSPYINQSIQWVMVCLSYAGVLCLVAGFVERWDDVAKVRSVVIGMALAQALWAFGQVVRGEVPRPTGTFFNPNFLAGYLATASVLFLPVICYMKVRTRKQPFASWRTFLRPLLLVGALAVLLVTFLQTGSRGGAVALVMGAAVVIVLRFGRRGLLGLVLLLIVAAFVPNPIRDRTTAEHMQNPEAYARWWMWQGAMREMIEYPFGVGIGLYQYTYPRYAFPIEDGIIRYGKVAQRPHNEYLQIGVELGLLGLGIFVWGIVVVAQESWWLLRQRLTRRQRALVVGLCAGIVVILAQAAVDSNFHEPALAILLALLVGSVSLGRTLCQKKVQPQWQIVVQRPVVWAALGVLVLGLLATHVIRLGLAYQAYEAGSRLIQEQEISQAIESFQRAISLDPGKSLYHNSLAGAYFQLSRRSQDREMAKASIAELQTAIALNPLDGRLQSLLGFASASQISALGLMEMRSDDRMWIGQAVEAYTRAAKLEPFAYAHRLELGRLMFALERRDAAEEHWKKVVELEPNYLPAREALARLYAESGRREAAELEYREILGRQQQFSPRVTNPLERSFLQVDAPGLHALLIRKAAAT